MTFYNKYFTDQIEYPDIGGDILPIGTLYEYISNTFLDGFINYVAPIKVFLLGRYRKWNEQTEKEVSFQDPPNTSNWKKFTGTKEEIYNLFIEKGRNFHVKFADLDDDVIILAKEKNNRWKEEKEQVTVWWFFWYDCDVSDCCIGRFITDEADEIVINDFSTLAKKDNDEFGEDGREITLHALKGWLSF